MRVSCVGRLSACFINPLLYIRDQQKREKERVRERTKNNNNKNISVFYNVFVNTMRRAMVATRD